MKVSENYNEAISKLQAAISKVECWTQKQKIKINENKFVHVDFTNQKLTYKQLFINNNVIPHENTAKYLGMTPDAKFRWKVHVKKKIEELGLKYHKMT